MKNYPLLYKDSSPRWVIWKDTYLKELNSKIWGLKNYSDYFLTDYQYKSVVWTEVDENQTYSGLSQLGFHNYTEAPWAGYLVDSVGVARKIHQGDLIVNLYRIEGGVDTGGYWIYSFEDSEHAELVTQAPESLLWAYVQLTSASSTRDNWKYFFVQARVLASYYTWSSIDATTRRATLIDKIEKNSGLQIQFILSGEGHRLTAANPALFDNTRSVAWYSRSLVSSVNENTISDSHGNCWTDDTLFPTLTPVIKKNDEFEPVVLDLWEKVNLVSLDGTGRLCYTTTINNNNVVNSLQGFVL